MTSLERFMAAINGEPMDMYPALNVSPTWSMMPHWPETLGLNFLHLSHGTDEQKLKFYDVLHDDLGLDYIPCGTGKPYGQRGKQYVTEEDGVPVLVDIGSRSKTRYHEFPPDLPPEEPLFETAADVERLDPPPTAEEMLATGAYDFTKKLLEYFDDTVFFYMGDMAPFPTSFYMLSYDKLFDAMFFQKDLVFALMDRHEEVIRQQCRLARMLGVHGYQLMQWFASADMISDEHYVEFALPGEIKAFQYIHDEGLISSMALMGWIEPRLPHLAKLDFHCIQVECGLKKLLERHRQRPQRPRRRGLHLLQLPRHHRHRAGRRGPLARRRPPPGQGHRQTETLRRRPRHPHHLENVPGKIPPLHRLHAQRAGLNRPAALRHTLPGCL